MAIVVTGTGPYIDSVSGTPPAFRSRSFFSGLVTISSNSYQSAPDQTVMLFADQGQLFGELVLINNGAAAFAFQWKENWGQSADNGIVLANSSIILRKSWKTGLKVRSAETGQSTSCLIWGL